MKVKFARWIETLSAYTFTVVHRAGRVHNNANSMARRSCHNSHCKNYDHYEQRYPPEKIADLNKNAGEVEAVKGIASKDGMTGG